MMELLTVAKVADQLGLVGTSHNDELVPVIAAVEALVTSYNEAPADGEQWPANLQLGAVMLAARIYRRRNSPAGVESMGEIGPVYVSRNDPDLAQLLKIGKYAPPKVG